MSRIRPSSPRRGVALILVITCLAVMTIVLGSLLQMSLGERRHARSEERRLRASWLAESGLERAWAKLSEDASYEGETWTIPAETLHDEHPATITITVEPIPEDAQRRRIRSQAVFPSSGSLRARQTRVIEIAIPANAPAQASDPGETR